MKRCYELIPLPNLLQDNTADGLPAPLLRIVEIRQSRVRSGCGSRSCRTNQIGGGSIPRLSSDWRRTGDRTESALHGNRGHHSLQPGLGRLPAEITESRQETESCAGRMHAKAPDYSQCGDGETHPMGATNDDERRMRTRLLELLASKTEFEKYRCEG